MTIRSFLTSLAVAVVLLTDLTGIVVGQGLPTVAPTNRIAQKDKPQAEVDAYARWSNGPGKDQAMFPIAVWLQDPRNAPKYKAVGINLYVGLWAGPTEQQMSELKRHGMPVICEQNDYALKHLDEGTIVGWMHGDEPDNAQSLGQGKGYGPPVPPAKIIEDYEKIKTRDPTRPVLLNLP